MANHENFKGAFDAITPVTITFTHRIIHATIWSEVNDIYIEWDEIADGTKFKIPQDTIYVVSVPCKFISIIGVGGAGTYECMAVYYTEVTTDVENEGNRGGVDVA